MTIIKMHKNHTKLNVKPKHNSDPKSIITTKICPGIKLGLKAN